MIKQIIPIEFSYLLQKKILTVYTMLRCDSSRDPQLAFSVSLDLLHLVKLLCTDTHTQIANLSGGVSFGWMEENRKK